MGLEELLWGWVELRFFLVVVFVLFCLEGMREEIGWSIRMLMYLLI